MAAASCADIEQGTSTSSCKPAHADLDRRAREAIATPGTPS
jgi:hypothetical protein